MLIALTGNPAAFADDVTSDANRAALRADLDALLRAELQEFPLYLNEDADGDLYRIALERTKEGTYTLEKMPVTDAELKELKAIGHRIMVTPDGQTPRCQWGVRNEQDEFARALYPSAERRRGSGS